jgi:tRNA-Thr(GGU) m(6)t(6)A37 methyltransferase TsaA
MQSESITLRPIGVIHSQFTAKEGTPIQPKAGKGIRGTVEIKPEFATGLDDLDGFERIWLVFWFHKSGPFKLKVVPFRDTEPRGLFSTRAPSRPNNIGISCVRLVEVRGNRLKIEDVDILDGTPLLDIKPFVPEFDCYDSEKTGWLGRSEVNRDRADRRFEDDSE